MKTEVRTQIRSLRGKKKYLEYKRKVIFKPSVIPINYGIFKEEMLEKMGQEKKENQIAYMSRRIILMAEYIYRYSTA